MTNKVLLLILLSGLLFSLTLDRIKTNLKWPAPIQKKTAYYSETSFELGRALFYDPLLSVDSSISCASCHLSYTSFAHVDHPTSHGIANRIGKRNAPGLYNLAWRKIFIGTAASKPSLGKRSTRSRIQTKWAKHSKIFY